jgi:hypothetical protein
MGSVGSAIAAFLKKKTRDSIAVTLPGGDVVKFDGKMSEKEIKRKLDGISASVQAELRKSGKQPN